MTIKLIELTKVANIRQGRGDEDDYRDTDEPGENGAPAAAGGAPAGTPVMVNVESIRCFYRRRNEAPGTRLTFNDGRGFVVTEHYSDVLAKVVSVGGIVDTSPNTLAEPPVQG